MNTFKTLLKIGFTTALAFLLQMALPWWSVAIAAVLISLIISTKGSSSFIAGFLGIAFLWFALAMISDIRTDSMLTERVAGIFSLPNKFLLMLLTAVVGGLVGGFSALTGSLIRNWLYPPETY